MISVRTLSGAGLLPAATQSVASDKGGPWTITNDLQYVYMRIAYVRTTANAWVCAWECTTPGDLSTMANGTSRVQSPHSGSYDDDDWRTQICVNNAGDQLITSFGDNYSVAGYIVILGLTTAGDVYSGVTSTLTDYDASYLYTGFQVSPDEKYVLVHLSYDDIKQGLYIRRHEFATPGGFLNLSNHCNCPHACVVWFHI